MQEALPDMNSPKLQNSSILPAFSIICLLEPMKAMQVNNSTQGPALIATELPQPQPGEGELLIQCPCGRGNAH